METLRIKLNGRTPLLMGNSIAVDPEHPIVQEIKVLEGLHHTKKTEEVNKQINRLRWHVALYVDDDDNLILPSINFESCLKDAAKLYSKTPKVKAGVSVDKDSVLRFDGEDLSIDELEADPKYSFRRVMSRQDGNKIIAVSPQIPTPWEAEFEIQYDPVVIEESILRQIIETSGQVGIGQWHEKFGKFEVEFTS